MKRFARYILGMLVLAVLTSGSGGGCKDILKPTPVEEKLYHVAIFSDSDQDVKVQCLNPDISGQGREYVLYHGRGVCSWDIKKYPHTFVFKHIVTGDVLRTIVLEPNSVKADRSHNGVQNLDAFYVYATGEWQNMQTPIVTDDK